MIPSLSFRIAWNTISSREPNQLISRLAKVLIFWKLLDIPTTYYWLTNWLNLLMTDLCLQTLYAACGSLLLLFLPNGKFFVLVKCQQLLRIHGSHTPVRSDEYLKSGAMKQSGCNPYYYSPAQRIPVEEKNGFTESSNGSSSARLAATSSAAPNARRTFPPITPANSFTDTPRSSKMRIRSG